MVAEVFSVNLLKLTIEGMDSRIVGGPDEPNFRKKSESRILARSRATRSNTKTVTDAGQTDATSHFRNHIHGAPFRPMPPPLDTKMPPSLPHNLKFADGGGIWGPRARAFFVRDF